MKTVAKWQAWILLMLLGVACSANDSLIYTDPQNRARVAELRSHLKGEKTDVVARYELVGIFLAELFFAEAEKELETLLLQNGNDVDAHHLLALVLVQGPKSDYARAVALLEESLKIAPNRIDTRLALALSYAQLGKYANAHAECNAILEISDDSKEKATTYLILSALDPVKQSEYFQKAIGFDPSIADSGRPITVPIYVGKRFFHEFDTHPVWPVRLKNLDSVLTWDR